MPNRFIKESICTSESVSQLSWFEEVFFYRLTVTVDDFGRFDARAKILNGRLFPLADVTDNQIEAALRKLATVGIVGLYTVDGRRYLQLLAWERHQSRRAKESKFPAPPWPFDEQTKKYDLQADANKCKQMSANAPVFVFENDIRNTDSYVEDENDARTREEPPPPDDLPGDMHDDALKETIAVFHSEHGEHNISPAGMRELAEFADELGHELTRRIITACAVTGSGGARKSWPYVRKALQTTKNDGVRSVAEFDDREARRADKARAAPKSAVRGFLELAEKYREEDANESQ